MDEMEVDVQERLSALLAVNDVDLQIFSNNVLGDS